MNGQDINTAITDAKDGTVASIVAKRGASYRSLPLAINDLFLATLNRPVTAKEINSFISPEVYRFVRKTSSQPTTQQFWVNYYQDIMWALLNSNEFILNH